MGGAFRSILIIADDLTGAADTAVQFRQAGLSAVVLARPAKPHVGWYRVQVLSLSLNTREASRASVRRIWARHSPTIRTLAQGALVYQKIDSTLRGHPALEVRLLLACLGTSAAVIVPAFPKLGRRTVDGVHRVHGVPLAETEYTRPRTRARATSQLSELLALGEDAQPLHLSWDVIDGGVDAVAQWLKAHLNEPCRLITADAADERHLDILSQAILPMAGQVLMVGSAGWAERLALLCKAWIADGPAGPGALGVVGSLSATATRQVYEASQAGMTVVPFPAAGAHSLPGETAQDWQSIADTLSAGRCVIFSTNPEQSSGVSRLQGPRVLRSVAGTVRNLLSTIPVKGLVIAGGDTAQAVLRALRASGLVVVGEVAPGVPYGRLLGGPCAGLPIVTKAGGFGADTVLVDSLRFLQSWTG